VQKAPAQKVVIKPKTAPKKVENEEEFERIDDRRAQQARQQRQGGDRRPATKGGDRRPRDNDNRPPAKEGGERKGRGGADRRERRPRNANPEAKDGDAQVERAERGGARQPYKGKAREENHPFDRKSGNPRQGRRDDKKQAGGKAQAEKKPVVAVEGEAKVEEETKATEVTEPVVVESEEEEGYTLDDFLADKQAKSKGLLTTATGRQHEKITDKNVAARDAAEKQRVLTIENKIRGRDVHAITRNEGAELLGFSAAGGDEDFEGRRGGRGGPRRDDRPRDNRRQGGRRGGGKIVVDDDAFPAL